MTDRRMTVRLQSLDPFTTDALNNMVRYLKSDRFIAGYLGVSEGLVRRVRARLPMTHPCGPRN